MNRFRPLLAFVLFVCFSVSLNAERPQGVGLSLSLSPYPAMYSMGYTYSPIRTDSDKAKDISVLYNRSKYSQKMTSLGTYTLGVDFFTGTLLSIGLSATFETDRVTIRETEDNSLYFSSNQSFLVPMLSVRANWFNRSAWRMYSYAGIGRWMRLSTFREVKEDSRKGNRLGIDYDQDTNGSAYHLCPFGVSYGKKRVAVFAELGYGVKCFVGSIGVSYMFGKKI